MAKKRDTGRLVPRRLTIHEIATMIADSLYTNGAGEKANYLKLFAGQRGLGGWGYVPAINHIEKILTKNTERV